MLQHLIYNMPCFCLVPELHQNITDKLGDRIDPSSDTKLQVDDVLEELQRKSTSAAVIMW